MQVGIRDGSMRAGWEETITQAARLGFDTVELNLGPNYRETAVGNEDGPARLRERADASGCAIRSLCVGALWKTSPAGDDDARAEALDVIETAIGASPVLGVRWILVPITPGGPDVDEETSVTRWVSEMGALAATAEEHGVTLCLENVGGGCGKSANDLIRLVDGVDHPAIQAYYDIGNAVAFGNDPVEEIRRLGSRIRIVHIKDHADRLGEGDVPIPACLSALRELDYDDCLVFETKPTDNPMRAAAFNLGYIKGILAAQEND